MNHEATNNLPSPGPSESGVQAFHQAALDSGRFLIQQCNECRKHVYFPRE
ncbi:MAG: zinc ribbon domain-containing protein, partial [Burkholderiaceae bacterium]